MLGLFDRPVSARTMLENPPLYRAFQERAFSDRIFVQWILLAIWHSLLLFFLTYFIMDHGVLWSHGLVGGWLMLGCSCYSYVVTTVCLKALLEADTWTTPLVVFSVGSIVSWFLFMIVYSEVWPYLPIGADMSGMAWIMMSSYTFWFGLLLVPIVTLLSDFVIKALQTTLYPSPRDLMTTKEKYSHPVLVHTVRVNDDDDDRSFEVDDDPITSPVVSSSPRVLNNSESAALHRENQSLIHPSTSLALSENGAYSNPVVVEDIELGTTDNSARFKRL